MCRSALLVPLGSLLLALFRFRLELGLFARLVPRVDDEDDGRHCAGKDLKRPKSEKIIIEIKEELGTRKPEMRNRTEGVETNIVAARLLCVAFEF